MIHVVKLDFPLLAWANGSNLEKATHDWRNRTKVFCGRRRHWRPATFTLDLALEDYLTSRKALADGLTVAADAGPLPPLMSAERVTVYIPKQASAGTE